MLVWSARFDFFFFLPPLSSFDFLDLKFLFWEPDLAGKLFVGCYFIISCSVHWYTCDAFDPSAKHAANCSWISIWGENISWFVWIVWFKSVLCSNVWQLKETCLISGHAGLRPLCCLDVFVQAFFSMVRLSPLWFWLDSCLYEVFGEKFQERGWEMREGALYGVLFLAGLQRVTLCTSRCLVGSPSASLGHEEWRALVSQPDTVL